MRERDRDELNDPAQAHAFKPHILAVYGQAGQGGVDQVFELTAKPLSNFLLGGRSGFGKVLLESLCAVTVEFQVDCSVLLARPYVTTAIYQSATQLSCCDVALKVVSTLAAHYSEYMLADSLKFVESPTLDRMTILAATGLACLLPQLPLDSLIRDARRIREAGVKLSNATGKESVKIKDLATRVFAALLDRIIQHQELASERAAVLQAARNLSKGRKADLKKAGKAKGHGSPLYASLFAP